MILVYIGRNNLIMCMFKKVGNFFFCLKIYYRFFVCIKIYYIIIMFEMRIWCC